MAVKQEVKTAYEEVQEHRGGEYVVKSFVDMHPDGIKAFEGKSRQDIKELVEEKTGTSLKQKEVDEALKQYTLRNPSTIDWVRDTDRQGHPYILSIKDYNLC